VELLPSPEEIAEDLGVLDPDPGPGPGTDGTDDRDRGHDEYPTGPDGPDQPPGHARPRARRRERPTSAGPARPPRVTAGIRTDIRAKVELILMAPGAVWAARDPICGGTFIEQIPDTSDAFTDIICDSPDLVAFFTGPGGAFMRWLKLGAALMPVGQAVMAHHVYHTVELAEGPDDAQQPAQYAA
jgi:hypothetical protein